MHNVIRITRHLGKDGVRQHLDVTQENPWRGTGGLGKDPEAPARYH
jgi:hypothetical protein